MHFKRARKQDSRYHETPLVIHQSSHHPPLTLCKKDRVGIWPETRNLGGNPIVWGWGGMCQPPCQKGVQQGCESQCSALGRMCYGSELALVTPPAHDILCLNEFRILLPRSSHQPLSRHLFLCPITYMSVFTIGVELTEAKA